MTVDPAMPYRFEKAPKPLFPSGSTYEMINSNIKLKQRYNVAQRRTTCEGAYARCLLALSADIGRCRSPYK